MSGDPTAVRVWDRIEVYKGLVESPTIPATATDELDPDDWGLVGLIDPAGFEETPSFDSTDLFEYSGNLIRSVQGSFTLTQAFTALERNEIVRGITWPGSTATKVVVPRHDPFPYALELFDGTHRERRIAAAGVQVSAIAPVTKTRTAADAVKVTVKVLATSDGTLFTVQSGDVA
jgi:hypothetical protein